MRSAHVYLAGVGRVGSALLGQLATRSGDHRDRRPVPDLVVRGVANSRRAALLDPRPTGHRGAADGERAWHGRLAMHPAGSSDRLVTAAIRDPHPIRVFVDCTASPDLPRRYGELVGSGAAVVTANKSGFVGPAPAARATGRVYHETTVGAALPVLRTLADLVATGDAIHRIEAAVSGTLSFLTASLRSGLRFSEALRSAHDLGLTEPDPRVDLSGEDVLRKAWILADAADLAIARVATRPWELPPAVHAGSTLAEFWRTLPDGDEAVARQVRGAAAAGRVLQYVATITRSRGSAGLRSIPDTDPCATAGPGEAVIEITSDRCGALPLVVRGPGAGPAVTAGGLVADVLRAVAEWPGTYAETRESSGSDRTARIGWEGSRDHRTFPS